MSNNVIPEVIDQITYLPPELQKQVLDYVKKLKDNHKAGNSRENLLRFAGSIPVKDLTIMSDAIEKGCGQVDLNEW